LNWFTSWEKIQKIRTNAQKIFNYKIYKQINIWYRIYKKYALKKIGCDSNFRLNQPSIEPRSLAALICNHLDPEEFCAEGLSFDLVSLYPEQSFIQA